MNIAVLLGGVGFDSQKRTINGILDHALPEGDNVYIFTCDGWNYVERFKYEEGEYNIFRLPDFTQYDGVIMNSDTIHDLKVTENIVDRIKKAKVPCVSLNQRGEGDVCVSMENKTGIQAIVEHLVCEHDARTIAFVSGPIDNHDAEQRLAAYKETMEQHGLQYQEENIFYGDYTYQSGMTAVEQYLNPGRQMPDAIMAANDEMAIGMILTLEDAGYRIPEDIIIKVLGTGNPFGVILATIAGIPMYADIFGCIPIAEALLAKGAQLGVVLSFMMGVTTLSLPSMIMLRKAVKPKLLGIFIAICTIGIIIVGYFFNVFQYLLI